jgi:hypothetical protein
MRDGKGRSNAAHQRQQRHDQHGRGCRGHHGCRAQDSNASDVSDTNGRASAIAPSGHASAPRLTRLVIRIVPPRECHARSGGGIAHGATRRCHATGATSRVAYTGHERRRSFTRRARSIRVAEHTTIAQ